MSDQRVRAAEMYEEARQRRFSGNPSGALVRYERCLELAEELVDRRWQAEIEREVGEMHQELYELPAALDRYERARACFTELGDAKEAWLTQLLAARVYLLRGSYQEARRQFTVVLEEAVVQGDERLEGMARAGLGQALCEEGRPEEGLPEIKRGLERLVAAAAPEADEVRDQIRALEQ